MNACSKASSMSEDSLAATRRGGRDPRREINEKSSKAPDAILGAASVVEEPATVLIKWGASQRRLVIVMHVIGAFYGSVSSHRNLMFEQQVDGVGSLSVSCKAHVRHVSDKTLALSISSGPESRKSRPNVLLIERASADLRGCHC
jgi:hypothetical protein